MTAPFTNPTAEAFARFAGMPGRSDTDQMMVNAEALQAARRRVFELESELSESRDALAQSLGQLDAMQTALAAANRTIAQYEQGKRVLARRPV